MPQKAKSKNSTSTSQSQNATADFSEMAQKNFEKAAQAGQKLYEMMPLAQKRMEEVMEIMQRSSRTGAELVQKAVDASQTPALADSQAKWMDFWTASLKATQTHVEAVTELSTNAIDSWLSFIRRNTEVTEVRVPRTA